jgi:ribosome silencing factor RsfS/YbeB/iojap
MTDPETPDTLALAKKIADLVRERRGQDLVLLDVRALVDYTDFFLVVTGQSARQNLAIAEHVVKSLKGEHRYAISKSGLDSGSWICLDMADVVVHVFDPETRAKYDLELLWADAPRVPLAEPLPAKPLPSEAAPAAKAEAEAAVAEEPATPKRRRRVVRQEAIPDADLENAPDAARPPEGEPEPEEKPRPLPPKLPKGKPREAPIATVRPPKAGSPKAPRAKAASKAPAAKPAKSARPAARPKPSSAKPAARGKAPRPRKKA